MSAAVTQYESYVTLCLERKLYVEGSMLLRDFIRPLSFLLFIMMTVNGRQFTDKERTIVLPNGREIILDAEVFGGLFRRDLVQEVHKFLKRALTNPTYAALATGLDLPSVVIEGFDQLARDQAVDASQVQRAMTGNKEVDPFASMKPEDRAHICAMLRDPRQSAGLRLPADVAMESAEFNFQGNDDHTVDHPSDVCVL